MQLWMHTAELLARVSTSAILNSLWQGMALAVVAWLALRAVPRTNAALRYGLWCVALVAVLALPLIAIYSTTATPAATALPDAPLAVPQRLAQVMLVLWYFAATILIARLIVSYVRLQQLKADAEPLPLLYQHRVRAWLRASGGRRDCRLCVSEKVPMPVAIGLIDPVIVLPKRLLDQLSDDELDQIGLHEVAHLQRWDDYTNVFQKVVEALLFFNPAVYLIGRQLTLEREIACDDRVIAATGKPLTYALCLTRLVEATALARQALPALSALSTRRQFAIRIERLLDKRRSVFPIASALAAVAACAAITVALVGASKVGRLVSVIPDAQPFRLASFSSQHAVAIAAVTASSRYANIFRISLAEVRRGPSVARSNAVGARNFTSSDSSHTVNPAGLPKATTPPTFTQETVEVITAQAPVALVAQPAEVAVARRVAEIALADVSNDVYYQHGARIYVTVSHRHVRVHANKVRPAIAPQSAIAPAPVMPSDGPSDAMTTISTAPLAPDTSNESASAGSLEPQVAAPVATLDEPVTLVGELRATDSAPARVAIVARLGDFIHVATARKAIIATLLHDDTPAVQLSALRVLAPHADLADVQAGLIEALNDCQNPTLQLTVISVLRNRLSDLQVRQALSATLLQDDSVRVQVAAVEALAPYADDPEVRAALEQVGGDGAEIVRLSVKRALVQRNSQ